LIDIGLGEQAEQHKVVIKILQGSLVTQTVG